LFIKGATKQSRVIQVLIGVNSFNPSQKWLTPLSLDERHRTESIIIAQITET